MIDLNWLLSKIVPSSFSPETMTMLVDSAEYFVHLTVVLIPLFIGASFVVGLFQQYLPPERVEGILKKYDEGPGNVVAASIGAVTPFCSCSTVPVLAGLLQAGAPLGLAFSFLLASPLVNEIAVILLLGLFGVEITIGYVTATFSAAVIGGMIVGRLGNPDDIRNLAGFTDGGCGQSTETSACSTGSTETACGQQTIERSHVNNISGAASQAWSFFKDTFPYLLVGITIGAFIHGVVPVSTINSVLGQQNPLAVPIAAVAGAPIYISVSGMLPIAASLSEQGILIGTVLAFVVGGAGVSIPNLILLKRLFKTKLLAIYALSVIVVGVVLGIVFNVAAV
jgi:uncharacterized membrane protein YraQ (UPF0718 family)